MEIGDKVLMRDFRGAEHYATVAAVHVGDDGEETGTLDLAIGDHAPIPVKRGDGAFRWMPIPEVATVEAEAPKAKRKK